MNPDISILLIDSDVKLLRGAEFALRGLGQTFVASNPDEATLALRQPRSYSVILTALTLSSTDGCSLLRRIRERHPESVRLLMVGKESVRNVSDAINETTAFRVLAKPFTAETLRRAVSEARAECERVAREREMLEGTLHGSLEAIAGMLAGVQPAAFGRAVRLRRMVTLIAEKVDLRDRWEVQVAALLSQFGTVWLPADLVERLCRNQPITAVEHSQALGSIDATLKLLQPIPRMTRVCEILRSVDLIPSHEARHSTPHRGDAERVFTLALDFDGLFAKYGSASEALREMESHIGRYHASYFDALREIVGARNTVRLIDVPLADIAMGQVFATDVRSPNDLLLVARGQPVTPPLLFKIRNDWHGFAIHTTVRMIDLQEQLTLEAESREVESHRAA